ncbi:MAG: single-stranded DNA-binding protein [Sphaerochaetaceae bacterium]|nr:single-stranded DNA-binding protein [Sphaerochaetaceae bacterium]
MNNLNSILIEGHLTQEPAVTTLPSGTMVCRFSIANNRYYRNTAKALVNEVSYIDVETWGALAEGCAKYLYKGRGVRVVGRLKQDRWQAEDGKQHEKHLVVAEHVEFHPEPKPGGNESTVDTDEPIELPVDVEIEGEAKIGEKVQRKKGK